jgi:hypothetical protein
MIKKSVFEDELIAGMQRELKTHAEKQGMENLVKAADYLHSAMDILDEAGLTAHSDRILKLLAKIARDGIEPGDVIEFKSLLEEPKESKELPKEEISFKSLLDGDEDDARGKPPHPKNPTKIHDPHTHGLTPEKQVKNLLEHGTPFNMADDGKADDLLDVDIDDEAIEIVEHPLGQSDFEDEKD